MKLQEQQIRKLTLAGMFAALAFACFSYLRIEIPMGMGLTGKIYVGHAFILLSALVLGARYGALSGAIGLALADLLAGYTTSAPPTWPSSSWAGPPPGRLSTCATWTGSRKTEPGSGPRPWPPSSVPW